MKLLICLALLFSMTLGGQITALRFNDSNEVMKKNLQLGPQFLCSTTKLQLEVENITDSWTEDGVKLALTYRFFKKSWGTLQHRIGWSRKEDYNYDDVFLGNGLGNYVRNKTNLNNQISLNFNSGFSVGLYHGFFATNNYSGSNDVIFQRNEFRSDTLILGVQRKWKNLLGSMITVGRTFTNSNYRLEDRVTFSEPYVLELDRKFNDKWLLRFGFSIGNVVLGIERAFYDYAFDHENNFFKYLEYSTFRRFLHYSGRHFSLLIEKEDHLKYNFQTRKIYIDQLRNKYGVTPFVIGEMNFGDTRSYYNEPDMTLNVKTGLNAILLENRLNIDIMYEWIPYSHQPYVTFNLLMNVL